MGRLGKWAIFMMEFNITYVSQKAVKGQALADFLVAHSFSLLKEECSNNEAEYEALIFGLLLALSMDIRNLQAYGDSQLVVRRINDIYEVCKAKLVPYYVAARKLMEKFQNVQVSHIPRRKNASTDALAKHAAASAPRWGAR